MERSIPVRQRCQEQAPVDHEDLGDMSSDHGPATIPADRAKEKEPPSGSRRKTRTSNSHQVSSRPARSEDFTAQETDSHIQSREKAHHHDRREGIGYKTLPRANKRKMDNDLDYSLEEATSPLPKRCRPARHSSGYFSIASPVHVSPENPSSPTSTLHSSHIEADPDVTAGFEDICRVSL